MANDKKFVVKNGLTTNNISFVDTVNSPSNTITVTMLSSDTLSVTGESGQLFSITDSLTGTIFSVNDISGIPSIEVDDDGTIRFAEFDGNVLIGTATDNATDKLQVNGSIAATGGTSANWNSAYGWGDHASAGYLTDISSESIKDLSDVYSSMSPSDGQVLTWDNTNSRWDAATPSGGGGITTGKAIAMSMIFGG